MEEQQRTSSANSSRSFPQASSNGMQTNVFTSPLLARVEEQFGRRLVRRTRSGYTSPDGTFAVVCSVSKTHGMRGHPSFWFGFHPYQKSFLESVPEGFLVLGCGSPETVLAGPHPNPLPQSGRGRKSDKNFFHPTDETRQHILAPQLIVLPQDLHLSD